jgi:hypothetical protein
MKAIKAISTALLIFLIAVAHAQTLEAVVLEDQFGERAELNEQTRWLIFSYSMDGNKWVREAFLNEAVNTAKMKEQNILYVADIHEMPGVISKLVAIPKMKKYEYPVGLDTEGKVTSAWQQKENSLTVYKLKNLSVEEVTFYSEVDSLERWLVRVLK